MRTLYDSTTAAQLPEGGDLYAAYVDGLYANVKAVSARFPGKPLVTIATSAATNAGIVLDVEQGDATPAQAPGWVTLRRHIYVQPAVYCSYSAWTACRAAFATQGVAEPLWWLAAYPGIGAQLYPGTVAHQYASNPRYDTSVVADYWPGVDPLPRPPLQTQETDMIASTATGEGYVVVRPTGAVFAYGKANYHGGANSPAGTLQPGDSIVGIALRPQNDGYWLTSASGGVYAYGAAQFYGAPN